MSTQVDYPIVGSFNNQRVTNIDAERSVNVFEYIDPKGKKSKVLICTSGITDTGIVFTGATGGTRGEFILGNDHFIVFGNNIYHINSANVAVVLTMTPLVTNVGYVGIDANQALDPQVIFVDGQNGYIYDTVNTSFTQITDSSFPVKPIDVCFLDGFFIVANGNTNQFQMSMLNQGLVWGPATNAVTTNIGALPNQLIVGASTISGPSGAQNFQTGVQVQLALGAGGSLAGTGLAVATNYYAIHVDATHIKLASSLANALSVPPIPITLTGDVTPIINMISSGQLQQGAITSHPGTIVACRTLHRRLFLFSQNFTEVWENAGLGTALPVRRNNSLLMEVGTPAIGSIALGFDKMFFLSQDKDGLGSVMEVVGTQSIPVSNRALDFQLAQYANNSALLVPGVSTGVTDARGIMIKENGIIFYRLNFTQANHTYVYNVTFSDPSTDEGRLWHEEEVLTGDRHPAQTHAYFNGKNYYGDYKNPILYVVDSQVYTNNGQDIRRMRIGQAVVPPGYQRTRIDRFHLDLQQGQIDLSEFITEDIDLLSENNFEIQTEASQDIILEDQEVVQTINVNPQVYLSLSKDGGQTYGYAQKAPMGKLGERSFRTVWRKLGVMPRGQAVVPKIEFFGEGPFIILGAAWVFEVMPE